MKKLVRYFLFCLLIFLPCYLEAQQKTVDSLLDVLKAVKEDTMRINTLNAISKEYTNEGNYEQAMLFANQAQHQAKKLGYQKGEAYSYRIIGMIYGNQGEPQKALESTSIALKKFTEIGNKKDIADSYNNIGLIYLNHGDYEKALQNHFKSLKIREEIGDKKNIADSYNNIGIIYLNHGDYAKALQNHFKSLKIREEIGDKKGISDSYNNIGIIYLNQGNHEKTLEIFLNSLKINEEIRNKQGIATAYGNIGNIYLSEKKYVKSLEAYFKNLKTNEEMGNLFGIATSYANIGNVYKMQDRFKESDSYLNQSLILFKKTGYKDGVKNVYFLLSELYDKEGDYKHAYNYNKLYSDIKDTLLNEQSSKNLTELQIKYDTKKKEKENLLLTQKNYIQQIEIEREKEKRRIQYILIISFIPLGLIVFVLLYYRSKYKQKTMMEKEISFQQKMRFKEVINAEEKERRRIAQELHDGLGQLLSTVKLNISATENLIDAADKIQFENSLSLLDTACDEVRTISHNLMPSVLIRLGLLSALRELARKINISEQITVNIETNFDERLDESVEVTIYRISQELLNNIIKHASAKIVTLTLNRNENDLFLKISDDGKEFIPSLIDKSEGIGWKNIYSRSAMLSGTIEITSITTGGTAIKIHFPKLFSNI